MRKFILIVFIAITIITFGIVHNIYSTENCDQITNQEAVDLLKELAPDVKVLEVRPAPVKGLWEFAVESKGQKTILYVDCSKKYLITGSILDLKTKANVTQERYIEISKVDVSKIPLDDAIVMGDKEAKYRVIVFTDPD
jgi:thiol:disulfide interchange protein DsbC